MIFTEVLKELSSKVEGSIGYVVMGMDGIPIDRYVAESGYNFDMVATESTSLLRTTRQAADELAAGTLREISFGTSQLTVVVVAITEEYVLLGALRNGTSFGKARYHMKRAALRLEKEFV
jgi:predicted regulator of Ras-like GTPase activity (Roadblock/LC7/MglB family)